MATKQNGSAKKKQRSPNKCRDWEKERRNRFNEAIIQLGELIKEAMRNNVNNDKTHVEPTQFPKIEIIQRAIIFMKKFYEEKSELKSQILALKVQLEDEQTQKVVKTQDAATQIYKKKSKCKLKNPKLPKVKSFNLKISKSDNAIQQCSKEITKADVLVTTVNVTSTSTQRSNLPIILPRPTINGKRVSENTIVVLPAPYVLPPRPILLPAAPPAIVLLNPGPHPQPNCKTSIPIVTRTGSEVTKTTMVNILPISAYSHPLSLVTNKRPVSKTESVKKNVKANKNTKKISSKSKNKPSIVKEKNINDNEKSRDDQEIKNICSEAPTTTTTANAIIDNPKEKEPDKLKEAVASVENKFNHSSVTVNTMDIKEKPTKVLENESSAKNISIEIPTSKVDVNTSTNHVKAVELKSILDKNNLKSKDKLPTILDNSLCENTVDGGNARLELAEELLAASPTAAFLMSFPLVSGNRADSPAEVTEAAQAPIKETTSRRNICVETPQPEVFYPKTTQPDVKSKHIPKTQPLLQDITVASKDAQQKIQTSLSNKPSLTKEVTSVANTTIEYPFVNLAPATVASTGCMITDPVFSLDFDCNLTKTLLPTYTSSYVSNSNFFYNKNDPFNASKNSTYTSSNISSGHEFNSLSLYPCAMEKYSSSKNKPDYSNVEDNLMKIGSSRLTYDIDLGWPHKSFDFVNPTTNSNTFNKDNILPTVTAPFSTFNPDFHVSLGSASNKRDAANKISSTYADTITNLYSQPTNFWQDELPFYGNNNQSTKTIVNKQQSYSLSDQTTSAHSKQNSAKSYEPKLNESQTGVKSSSHIVQQMPDKYTKKSPNKMHINWMTSETRPIMSINHSTTPITELKDPSKPTTYGQINQHHTKKHDNVESNYFPIQINNLPTQIPQEEFQVWPSSRPLGTTEISIEPPPINLPTLVGDLALGPHEKKRFEHGSRVSVTSAELPNCNSFLSVTQLMNRTNENMASRYHVNPGDASTKPVSLKQNTTYYTNENVRKNTTSKLDSNFIQPYVFDEKMNHYDILPHFSNTKAKASKPSAEKNTKTHKNNYSAEALIRGGTQKVETPKFMMAPQKYNNLNSTHDCSVAQVSHFPPILDYTDNGYAGQQLGTSNLYNSTTSTISNSFYTNFMPSSSNLMSTNYPTGNFSGDFIDYNQSVDCNYANQKYEEFKMKNNPPVFSHEKAPSSNYRNNRRESVTKHKLECSKKDSKKYPSKKSKLNTEIDEWSDSSHLLWHNRTPSKKHGNFVADELAFPNYSGNQIPGQYQSEFFNSHLMPTNVQGVGHNVDRSVPSFPVTSRANFNLSTIFPEITMKVQ